MTIAMQLLALALLMLPRLALTAEVPADLGFALLDTERQEQLYYTNESLPESVKTLIAAPIPVAEVALAYANETNEIKRFNIIVILDKKLREDAYQGDDRDAAIAILMTALESGNPWIKTEAIFALGNAKAAGARDLMVQCLDDPSLTVTFHAVVALQQTFGELPPLTETQVEKLRAFAAADQTEDGKNALADKELAEYRRPDVL